MTWWILLAAWFAGVVYFVVCSFRSDVFSGGFKWSDFGSIATAIILWPIVALIFAVRWLWRKIL